MKLCRVALSLLLVWLPAQAAFPCSSVFVDTAQAKLVGRTMDWKTGQGQVCVNARGVSKRARNLQDKSTPAAWVSKYGSVTFNLQMQFGLAARVIMWASGLVDLASPTCGLNEAGLWGASLWLHTPPNVAYPPADARPTLNDWQLVEYLLDTCGSVQEVVDRVSEVRVAGFKKGSFEADLHWFFADANGDSAIIEFPDGVLRVHRRPEPPVMTNSFFEHSREYARDYQGFGGQKPVPLGTGETTSENRFLFASQVLRDKLAANQTSVSDVFYIMRAATQTDVRHASTSTAVTQWTTVYDLAKRELSWTSRTNPKLRSLRLSELSFGPSPQPRKMDIHADVEGDAANYLK